MQKYTFWRIVSGFMSAYHLIYGAILMASGEVAIRLAKQVGGATIEGTPSIGIVGEILACYAMTYGVLLAMVTYNPSKYWRMIPGLLSLIVFSLFRGIVFSGKTIAVWQMEPVRHWLYSGFVALLGILLFLFWWRLRKDMAGS